MIERPSTSTTIKTVENIADIDEIKETAPQVAAGRFRIAVVMTVMVGQDICCPPLIDRQEPVMKPELGPQR